MNIQFPVQQCQYCGSTNIGLGWQHGEALVTALLKDGRARITGCYSEKTGKTYTATVALTDDGTRASFRLEFSHE